jgi:hypothetical protein
MSAVAFRFIARVLAGTQPGVAGFFGREYVWNERRAFVAAIAERLRLRQTTGAERILFASFQLDFDWSATGDYGLVRHEIPANTQKQRNRNTQGR